MKRRWIYSLLTASLVAGMVGTSYADVKVSGGELRLRGVMVDNSEGTAALKDGGFGEILPTANAIIHAGGTGHSHGRERVDVGSAWFVGKGEHRAAHSVSGAGCL